MACVLGAPVFERSSKKDKYDGKIFAGDVRRRFSALSHRDPAFSNAGTSARVYACKKMA
jgi:hypothetical protein